MWERCKNVSQYCITLSNNFVTMLMVLHYSFLTIWGHLIKTGKLYLIAFIEDTKKAMFISFVSRYWYQNLLGFEETNKKM